jgi:pyridoxal phosphate enzyme (YggS family)
MEKNIGLMAVNIKAYEALMKELGEKNITLVAVSKLKPVEDIMTLYELGHRDFGENYVQELIQKQLVLPSDIRWHFIGHLQRNKAKYIVPFVHLIHGVESYKLLEEIDRQAQKINRNVNCLLQVHIAEEETKFGLNQEELKAIIQDLPKYSLLDKLKHVTIKGLMGMATFSEDKEKVRKEFRLLKVFFDDAKAAMIASSEFDTISMGMSDDFRTAIEEGSTMVRIGSLLFGRREML